MLIIVKQEFANKCVIKKMRHEGLYMDWSQLYKACKVQILKIVVKACEDYCWKQCSSSLRQPCKMK